MGCPSMTSPVNSEFWELWNQDQTSTICHTKYLPMWKRGTHSLVLFSSVASGTCKPKLSDSVSPVFNGFWVTASTRANACLGLHPLVVGEPAQDSKHVNFSLFPQGNNLPHVAELEGAGTGRASPEMWAPHSVLSSLGGENTIFKL